MIYKFYNPDDTLKAKIKANSQEEAEAILESEEDDVPVKEYSFEVSIGIFSVKDRIEIEKGSDSKSTVEDYITSMESELFEKILEETELPHYILNEDKFFDNLFWTIDAVDGSGVSLEDWIS